MTSPAANPATNPAFLSHLNATLAQISADGLMKREREITSAQGARVMVGGRAVINLSANNYLGLAGDARLVAAAKSAMDDHGYGMASVRFICGTQDLHRALEGRLARYLGADDSILFAACFDANGGLFEPLLGEEDAVISDSLNHASIIDGIRLCKSMRYRYEHNSMDDLEAKLKQAIADGAVQKMIVTDSVFSMDGTIAQLDKIVALAEKYEAMIMIDECHSSGFMGKTGRGVHELKGVMGKIDIITGTLGKALGGASGGFTSGRKEIIDLLRQRSRPYLFSNTLAPSITGASIAVFDLLSKTTELRDKLEENTAYFRERIVAAGFDVKPGEHPIVPIMLYDAVISQKMAEKLLQKGIYVIGFYYPVVAKGQARIRVQISAAHTREQLDHAIAAFTEVGKELGVIA